MTPSTKSFLLIDSSETMHGITFAIKGGRMDRFRANPVMLYMHQRGDAIGRWENIRQEGAGWMADPVFDTYDAAAARIAGKVERGFLRACSVGVAIHDAEEIGGKLLATDWEVYECSIVDAGSNANALSLYTPAGEQVKDPTKYIQELTLTIMNEKKDDSKGAATVAAATPAVAEAATAPLVAKETVAAAIALAAGLAEDATATLVADTIKGLTEENKALKLAAEASRATQIKSMLDQAVADKKISATERPHYETLAAVSLDSVQAIIGKLVPPVDLVTFANQGKAPFGYAQGDSEEEVLAEAYRKLDQSGKLMKLQASDPAQFKKMFKARFGVEYKE